MRISDDTDTATRQLLEEIMALRAAVKDLAEAMKWARPRLNFKSIDKETFGVMKITPIDYALARHKDLIDGL